MNFSTDQFVLPEECMVCYSEFTPKGRKDLGLCSGCKSKYQFGMTFGLGNSDGYRYNVQGVTYYINPIGDQPGARTLGIFQRVRENGSEYLVEVVGAPEPLLKQG